MKNLYCFTDPTHVWIIFGVSTLCFVIFTIWWLCFVFATKGHSSGKPLIFKWITFIFCVTTGLFSYFLLDNYLNNEKVENSIQGCSTPFVCIAKAGITPPKKVVTGGINIAGPSAGATRYSDDYSVFLKDPNGIIHRVDDMQLYFRCIEHDTIYLNAYKDNEDYKLCEYHSEVK